MGKIGANKAVKITELKPYEKNARTHSADQIKQIAESIKEFGFISPVLIDEQNNVIAGHGRIMAAKKLGMESVPCLYVEGLTEEQKRAYILADNRLTELGGWNMDLVDLELSSLNELGFDTSLTGFEIDLEDVTDIPDDKYTTNINIPQYEPSGDGAYLGDCVDTEKYKALLDEIEQSKIPDSEKDFLRLAAARHIAFNYKNIAEYYATADAEMQKLMEKSALVIIDYDDAIRDGYAKLSGYLDEIEERGRE